MFPDRRVAISLGMLHDMHAMLRIPTILDELLKANVQRGNSTNHNLL